MPPNKFIAHFLFTLTFIFVALGYTNASEPIDSQATPKTKLLFQTMLKRASEGQPIAFGMQDATLRGVGWVNEKRPSDFEKVCGKFPAIIGWDVGYSTGSGGNYSQKISDTRMAELVREAWEQGAVSSFYWSMTNPMTGGKALDPVTAGTVKSVLPNGDKHSELLKFLDAWVELSQKLRDAKGELIPVIFRPWHEHNQGGGKMEGFWWGKGGATEAEYQELWRFTVHYLRDVKQVHNLLYCFAPISWPIRNSAANYAYGWPGNEYVDICGLDAYYNPPQKSPETYKSTWLVSSLAATVAFAEERGKVPALAEVGDHKGLTHDDFWGNLFLKELSLNPKALHIAYAMSWYNAKDKFHFIPDPQSTNKAQRDDFLELMKSDHIATAETVRFDQACEVK
jgi:mannan endo-1,4-beta-mannosidase